MKIGMSIRTRSLPSRLLSCSALLLAIGSFGLGGFGAAFGEKEALAFDDGSRSMHRFGVYVSVLGDPFPSLWGINVGYNLESWMRLHAGYGSTSVGSGTSTLTVSSLGGGVHFFVPGWSLSPVVGVSITNLTASVSGSVSGLSVNGISSSGLFTYGSAGLEWQTYSGLTIGVGYNFGLSGGLGGAPSASFGWYF